MAKQILRAHPDAHQPDLRLGCKVSLLGAERIKLEFVAVGRADRIRLAGPAEPVRTDGLWNATCFEMFVSEPGGGYVEYNFAPSGAWASYRFTGYRTGMRPALDLSAPDIVLQHSPERIALTAIVDVPGLALADRKLALSAVIEDVDGSKSYWALAHPPGQPDFHHADCFALSVAAPQGT